MHIHVSSVNNLDKIIAFPLWDQGEPGDEVGVVMNFANRLMTAIRLECREPGNGECVSIVTGRGMLQTLETT